MRACIKSCQNCFNQSDDSVPACKIFKDPAYQWKRGPCYGRVTDLEQYRQREKAVEEYGSGKPDVIKPYVHEYVIGVNGSRKSLWFTCRMCEYCNGVAYEDEKHENWYVSADCKHNGKDIIKDKAFTKCPLNKWAIKRPKAI